MKKVLKSIINYIHKIYHNRFCFGSNYLALMDNKFTGILVCGQCNYARDEITKVVINGEKPVSIQQYFRRSL